ncbi:kallistatin [Otolemur garnettii]|uniref:kallistatin n=1 Tax=Otolemur garnettii TaxID=30611 RepID=UPI0002740152|nr:kallistatin [Otolemur garnettii]
MHCAYRLLLLAALLALSHGQPHPQLDSEGHTNSSHQQVPGTGENYPSLKIAPANTEFAFHFYHLIASENPGKNIFFSPLSISAAFAMLSLGARSHSQTQILEGLGFNLTEMSQSDIHRGFQHLLHTLNLPSHEMEMHVGSALFLHHNLPFLPQFLNDTKAFYESVLFHTDFRDTVGATQLINNYVKKETQGKIVDLVSELNKDVLMVLVNYIYFKALWEKPFLPSMTTPSNFYVDEDTTVQVPMMLQTDQNHWYLHDRYLPCSVLRMDYKGDAMALFILPHQGKMKQLEEVLSLEILRRWSNLLQKRTFYRKLELHFPKFSISGSYTLHQILPNLGFIHLFSPWANFSGITDQLNLQALKSFHKATLDVNEVGTTATAASSFSLAFLSAQKNHRVLWFNRPFLLAIISTSTQSVLFLGKIVDPTKP